MERGVIGGYAFMKMRTPDEPETDVNLEALFNYTYLKNNARMA